MPQYGGGVLKKKFVKYVVQDLTSGGVNGYVCDTAEEYAEHIKAAMKEFPKELPERA